MRGIGKSVKCNEGLEKKETPPYPLYKKKKKAEKEIVIYLFARPIAMYHRVWEMQVFRTFCISLTVLYIYKYFYSINTDYSGGL